MTKLSKGKKAKKTSWQTRYIHLAVNRYNSYMPKRRRHRAFVWAGVVIIAVIIAGQLAYPTDRALPFARIHDENMTLASHSHMARIITEQFASSKLRLVVGNDKAVTYDIRSAGAEPNTEQMIRSLTEYPIWQRLLPGSILWNRPHLVSADVYYVTDVLRKFSDERSRELTFAPQNARLAIEKGKLVATEAVAGSMIKSDDLLAVISGQAIELGQTTTLVTPAMRKPADRTAKDLDKVRRQAESVLAHIVTIATDQKTFSPSQEEIASWVVLSTASTGDVTLSIDKPKIIAYLDRLNKEVGTPAGQTNITIIDGREMGRTTGAMGRAIDASALSEQLAQALMTSERQIKQTASFVPVQPSVIFNSKYTATQAGLQAYIDDVSRQRNMYISIRQLTGQMWQADTRATISIPSGSTYKLYVALVLFDRIDNGQIHWNDPMLDTTVAGCFERMTVASTNPCAEKWIAEFGRQYINDFVHARGFSGGTSFTTGSANQTTANDLTKYMIGLNDGSLVGGANRDRLLDSLGRHPYRYGIPTGSAGAVNDKVGFLWDYIHDTAIVRHPRGTYIMTIMTKGQSYGAIANVTREIERIMYP
jgi:vancomycin resistance protein YoaR